MDAGATTVKAVMDAAEALPGVPKLGVIPEADRRFLRTIIVSHSGGTAESGQNTADGTSINRTYPDGVYVGEDDKVSFSSDAQNPILVSDDGLPKVQAWQYYVYNAAKVDLNRAAGPRRIVPYTDCFPSNENPRVFQDDDTVVWRQVSICVAPTFGANSDSLKVALASLNQ